MARAVLVQAVEAYRHDPTVSGWLAQQVARLDGPLRIAVAGKVKAGKSTLLNALVGEQIAPADAGECTKVVTWYRAGRQPRITLFPRQGAPVGLAVDRRDGALVIDLGGTPVDDVDHLEVDWPTPSLRVASLIDTPGIASMSTEVGKRALRFLDPEDERPTEADAVVYLMRHLHAADAEFLEAFRDQGVSQSAGVNAVAVISRADEIGGGRVDAMVSARAVARRYRTEPVLRGLAQNVVAVAGLLAETARTLRHTEFAALAALAAVPREDLESALLTADRFLRPDADIAGLAADDRARLLRRFGVFGLRLGTVLIRQGYASPAALAAELLDRSGLHDLQQALDAQFVQRRDVLKARSALLAVLRVVADAPARDGGRLAAEVERIFADAHEFAELRLLGALRSRAVTLPGELAAEAQALLGERGAAAPARLGLPADAPAAALRDAALTALDRWQRRAENPMLPRGPADACRVVVRTCEGLLATLDRVPAYGR
ncbi:dynamin family protein [Pseudonocardia charpentierae]|uniref:Dynamin family protein n=1 Tax=Pseudonocardia charpentierae TaxID=3075545 RepID=A0ABU2N476_9PSEU|nr:dynamin family protein [Pseudonocardia sp. DSM 45834]MDT0348541.1 dynamin family protein [Pseudonocardia sp. DSM 45834]